MQHIVFAASANVIEQTIIQTLESEPLSLIHKGDLEVIKGNFYAAISKYTKALHLIETKHKELEKVIPIIYKKRSLVNFKLCRFFWAEKDINKAIELAPNEPVLYVHKGGINYYQHKYDIAAQCFERALELEKMEKHPIIHMILQIVSPLKLKNFYENPGHLIANILNEIRIQHENRIGMKGLPEKVIKNALHEAKNKYFGTLLGDLDWIQIFQFCTFEELMNLSLVSHRFYRLSNHDLPWLINARVNERFPTMKSKKLELSKKGKEISWKEIYLLSKNNANLDILKSKKL